MIQEEQKLAIRNLIETGNLKQFKEIFLYVKRSQIHEQMGINYNRFLRIINNPKKFSYEDTYQISAILGVTPRTISELIHNQIESEERK